ncbi:Rab3 GTPase-activating protein catalytic subunit [Hondaea fermentalgiana]|uniref:Rab3 GTPase-activating protein catalytic subunit n=1 Tax=Hondaea fermentalgiana TaxID=2315210 RepID=A0A2R5GLJ2_9STRA|nr:Rab3 GTPase-activating protein catalytic subunit [Hondaea fermentalgiana]|eukprot:GBG30608.1 Rab3 GTPase-activating protein catalytic subunit [Hondaea fermentalgiana]
MASTRQKDAAVEVDADAGADAPEWADYSNASAAETFVAALEMLLAQWGLSETTLRSSTRPPSPAAGPRIRRASHDDDDGDADSHISEGDSDESDDASEESTSFKAEELPLGKDRFSVLYVPHPEGAFARAPKSPVEARLSLAEIMLLTKCATFAPLEQPYALEQLFGVAEYVVLSPTQRRANLNDVSLLLSSASLALPTCARPVPCFVPVPRGALDSGSSSAARGGRNRGRRYAIRKRLQGALAKLLPNLHASTISYFGTWVASADSSPGTVIHFNSVEQRIGDVPKTLHSLGGVCRLFRSKIGWQRSQHASSASASPPSGWRANARSSRESLSHAAAAAAAAGVAVSADVMTDDNESESSEHSAETLENDLTMANPDKLLAEGNVLVSVRYSYEGRRIWNPALLTPPTLDAQTRATNWTEWHDSDLGWRLHIDHFGKPSSIVALRGGLGRPPLWGPLSDPVASVSLQVIWPPFADEDVVDNETISTLMPESAPIWVVEVSLDKLDARGPSRRVEGSYHATEEYEQDAESEHDFDSPEGEASCPLTWSVRFLQRLVEASMSETFHDSMLSRLPTVIEDEEDEEARAFGDFDMHLRSESGAVQPGGPMNAPPRAGRGARNTSLENERVRDLIKDLFTASHEEELPRTVLEQLMRLKELYMNGSLTNHEFRDAKARILIEAGHMDSSLDIDASSSWTPSSSSFSKGGHFNELQRSCNACWLCSSTPSVQMARSSSGNGTTYKGAPEGSLLSIFALRVIPEFGASMSAVSALWRAFVAELRWYWDNAVLIPIHQDQQMEIAGPVDHRDCLLHQKLVLLNICISCRAHSQFEHAKDQGNLSSAAAATSSFSPSTSSKDEKDNGGEADAEAEAEQEAGLEEGSDTFFDAASAGPGSPTRVQMVAGMRMPWTLETCLMTEDMARERTELMASLAMKQNTADLHRDMLSKSLRSEIAAFKAANPDAVFEDFKRCKGRARMLGDYWRKLWNETKAETLREQVARDSSLFSYEAEAEKLLHYFETVPPQDALEDIFVVGLQSAVHVLRSATDSFDDYAEIHALLGRSLMSASAHLTRLDARRHGPGSPASPSRRGRGWAEEAKVQCAIRESALDGLERTELLLGLAASLLHKFPATVAESMLAENEATGRLATTLETVAGTERQHVRSLLFPESAMDSLAMPNPDRREFVLRALARRGSFQGATWVRPGANRMFVSMTQSSFTLATSLTETSFA